MKLSSHHFIIVAVKQNTVFFISILTAMVLFLVSSLFVITVYQQDSIKIEETKEEITQLRKRVESLSGTTDLQNEGFDLAHMSAALGQLIPNQEDFFSIMIALERLSSKTNFLIGSYDILLDQKNSNSMAFDIHGAGDENSFVNLLENYRFVGGRLITVENVTYNKTNSSIDIRLTLHSGKSQVTKSYTPISEKEKELMREILEKTTFELKSSEVEPLQEYPVKSNPF